MARRSPQGYILDGSIRRLAIAWQNVAYNQPPHPSFYLGDEAPLPPRPRIVTLRRK